MLGNINNGFGGYDAYSAQLKYSTQPGQKPEVAVGSEQLSPADKALITTKDQAIDAGLSRPEIRAMERTGQIECEACANRKYQDGSDEQVSFKSAQHISPEAAASRVRGHEQEHVANAYDKAKQNNGKVLNANVMIKTAVCPECGKVYVSGGVTHTQIKYNDKDPYQANAKSSHYANLRGSNFDFSV